MTPSGTVTPLYQFPDYTAPSPDGDQIVTPLLQGMDGALYGAIYQDGHSSYGFIYRLAGITPLPPPISSSTTTLTPTVGQPYTVSWSTANATSATMQECEGFVNGIPYSGAGPSGSYTFTPDAVETITLALTCGGVESSLLTETVNGTTEGIPTTTTLVPSAYTITQPAIGVLQATVPQTGGSVPPTGMVTFFYNGQGVVGIAPLSASGTATLPVNTAEVAPGIYMLTATYSGDSNYASSTSPAISVTVQEISDRRTARHLGKPRW
jgi:hypothetical protein